MMSDSEVSPDTHYNLIIGVGWGSEIFEQSSGNDAWMPADRMPGESVRFDALASLPTLAMPEIDSKFPTPARVTRISNIRPDNRGARNPGFAFNYVHLAEQFSAEDLIPEILSSNRFIGNRTQWHVWEGDLIRKTIRLLRQNSGAEKPTFFGLQDWPLPKLDHVAVMMPYASEFDSVYRIIKKACGQTGRKPHRVIDVTSKQPIIADVFATIVQSTVVICDITGLNPNVLYEAGIAHARNVPVILITQDTGNPPFNLSQTQVTRYVANREGLDVLETKLATKIRQFAE